MILFRSMKEPLGRGILKGFFAQQDRENDCFFFDRKRRKAFSRRVDTERFSGI